MNPYALAWTITAAVGALLSAALLWESVLDLRALGSVRNGRRWRVWGRMAQEAIRLCVHVPFFVIGLLALNTPLRPESAGTILVLLWGNLAFIANSLIAMVVRHQADQANTEATAAELEARAGVAAQKLLDTAEDVAAELVDVAEQVGGHLDASARGADAAERTADNTERIATNTDPAA